LAGGSSSRFGSDKALTEISGQPQLLRLKSMLVADGHDVEVVADRADRYEILGSECLVDQVANCGPLAGLATALRHRTANHGPGWLLLIGCDQLIWRKQWWDSLSAKIAPGIQAITFGDVDDDKRPFLQPIPGMYHTSIEVDVTRRLDSGPRSLRRLLADARAIGISTDQNPRSWAFNTPNELRELLDQSADSIEEPEK